MFLARLIIGTFFTGSVVILIHGIIKASAIVAQNGPPRPPANDEERRQRLERLGEAMANLPSHPPRGLRYYYDSRHDRHYYNT